MDANPEDLQYCPISKGYSMQDVSSFTLGPVVGEGLCVVNAAFSKTICIMHIEGGGVVDLKRKSFWKPKKNPTRHIEIYDNTHILVDGVKFRIIKWLKNNLELWFDEWDKWRKSIAVSSIGDFHWTDNSPRICFKHGDNYLDFVTWKKECYIKPAYELIIKTNVYKFLKNTYNNGISLGLVHPKGKEGEEHAITKEYIRELYDDENIMACMFRILCKILKVFLDYY